MDARFWCVSLIHCIIARTINSSEIMQLIQINFSPGSRWQFIKFLCSPEDYIGIYYPFIWNIAILSRLPDYTTYLMRWDFVFLMNGFPCWPLRRLLAFVLILHNHEIKWKILLSCLTSLISYILPSCEYTFEVYINLGYFLIFDEQKIKWCMRKFYSLNNETSYVQLL